MLGLPAPWSEAFFRVFVPHRVGELSVLLAGYASMAVIVLGLLPVGSPIDSRERKVALDAEAQAFVRGALGLGDPVSSLETGMYAGTRAYERSPAAQGQDSAPELLVGGFLLLEAETGGRSRPVARVHLVAERDTCFLRSSQIIWLQGEPPESLSSLASGRIALVPLPLALSLSPLRLMVRGGGRDHRGSHRPDVDRARVLHEAAAAAQVERLDFPIRSELLAPACSHFGKKDISKPRPVHRDLIMDYPPNERGTRSDSDRGWAFVPEQSPSCHLQTSPFGTALAGASDEPEPPLAGASEAGTADVPRREPWTVLACLASLTGEDRSWLAPTLGKTFDVVTRNGRHVTLSLGRSSGLVVGSRLVSESGATLHIIRIRPSKAGRDQAVAFIRSEPVERALAIGDKVTFDPRLYPK